MSGGSESLLLPPASSGIWRRGSCSWCARGREATAAARRFRPGQRLHLPEPLGFRKGAVIATEFEVVPPRAGRRGPIFRPVGQSFLCRSPKRLLALAMTSSSAPVTTEQLALLP